MVAERCSLGDALTRAVSIRRNTATTQGQLYGERGKENKPCAGLGGLGVSRGPVESATKLVESRVVDCVQILTFFLD